jgi:hypothetical protein
VTAEERLALIGLKIERAKKHIEDLNVALGAFKDSNPYEVAAKRDPQTRQLIYYVSKASATPASVPTITGDILQNLRSALDHLAYQMFLVGTGGLKGAGFKIYFPIERSVHQFKSRFEGKVEGMRTDAKDAIRALEPYNGGKGHDFWVLNELNNIDKHRLLVTVGYSFRRVDIMPTLLADFQASITKNTGPQWEGLAAKARDHEHLQLFLTPGNKLCPLKEGDQLLIDRPDAEPNQKISFLLDVAIHEPGVIESKPLLETVQYFTDLVANTVLAFKPCLA